MSQYKKIWNEIGLQLFEKLATEPIKGKYVRGKLKKWKKRHKNKFSNNATAVLKIDSVYK